MVILGYETGASNVVTKEIKRIEVMELLVNGKMPNQEAAESLRAYEGSFGRTSSLSTCSSTTCFHPLEEVSEGAATRKASRRPEQFPSLRGSFGRIRMASMESLTMLVSIP